jgi:nitroimidazol reductase NimA-like FMN-containing flavoprotein (pyridoxamine 5'-phosphate oxidase superfamily)
MTQKGPWSGDRIRQFLQDIRVPIRLGCNGASGHPVLVSLWFVPLDGKLWCATPQSARVASLLGQDPRCAFEVSVEAPPYRGVRGAGLASLSPQRGEEILRILIERYLGDTRSKLASLLLARVADETAICIEPQTLVSWDYQARMRDVT